MVELIIEAEPKLMERLVELEQEAFGYGGMNEWHLVPIIRHGKVFVSKDNDVVVGAVQYMRDWDNPELAYMISVSVAGEARGKGIGTELLAKSIEILFDDKIIKVELTVEADNVAAVKVYKEKLGFEVTEFRKNEYGPGQDRLVMVLTKDKYIEDVT
ncbi:Mycothiol acetyltransferase [Sporomusa silvacetica DSM 10669]|uniref:Mycothiol acetyltransferase n=1 Tax=Sporomusa silvacetica DSM 10669 TaxID=1123289 RepID=A0ABZ3IG95_9FIRM|nr:GNAT family N-acetyltransferase [Sporomusa silvacetica]OZC16890.1 mycothiol acetyltransferase [Sporomusa silvacetica DSM 10669]